MFAPTESNRSLVVSVANKSNCLRYDNHKSLAWMIRIRIRIRIAKIRMMRINMVGIKIGG